MRGKWGLARISPVALSPIARMAKEKAVKRKTSWKYPLSEVLPFMKDKECGADEECESYGVVPLHGFFEKKHGEYTES